MPYPQADFIREKRINDISICTIFTVITASLAQSSAIRANINQIGIGCAYNSKLLYDDFNV